METNKSTYTSKTPNNNEASQHEENDDKYSELEKFLNGQLPEDAEHDVMALIDNDEEMREVANILLDIYDIQLFEELKREIDYRKAFSHKDNNNQSKINTFEKIVLLLICLAVLLFIIYITFI